MGFMELTISLKVDFDGEEKQEIMLEAVKGAGAHLLSTALLIADKRKPTIAIITNDHFFGEKEVSLFCDPLSAEAQEEDAARMAAAPDVELDAEAEVQELEGGQR